MNELDPNGKQFNEPKESQVNLINPPTELLFHAGDAANNALARLKLIVHEWDCKNERL